MSAHPGTSDLSWRDAWQALKPFTLRVSEAGPWLAGGLTLGVLALVGALGLLGLSGAFLTGAAIAGLSASTAATFNFFMPGAGVRFFAVLRTTTRWGERVLSHEGTFRLLAGLRRWLYAHLAALSPRQLMRYHGAELLNRLVRDIDALDNLHPRLLMPLAAAGLVLGGVTIVFLWQAPTLIWAPVLLWVCAWGALPVTGWHLGLAVLPRWTQLRAELRTRLLDTCEGLEALSLHRQAWADQRRRTLVTQTQWLRAHLSSQRRSAVLRAGVILSVGLMGWGVLGALSAAPAGERLAGPWIAALVLIVMGCVEALQPLASACVDLPGTARAAQRLLAIAEEPASIHFPEHGPPPADASIRLHQVCFAWDEHTPVLRQFDLTIADGEHVLLTGESGCGKSTLLQLLTRQETASAGEVHLGGVPIQMLDEATLRQHVACAAQFSWAQTATLADNLRLARPDATETDMLAVLEVVGLSPQAEGWREGLNTWIDEGGANLSGGQRRRLGVARTLLRQAPITLLDEPSEGLDLAAEAALVVRVTQHLRGRTLVWVSHRPAASGAFQRVVHLEREPDGQ